MSSTTTHNKAAVHGWSVNQSRHMSAILVGSCLWLHCRGQWWPCDNTSRELLTVWWQARIHWATDQCWLQVGLSTDLLYSVCCYSGLLDSVWNGQQFAVLQLIGRREKRSRCFPSQAPLTTAAKRPLSKTVLTWRTSFSQQVWVWFISNVNDTESWGFVICCYKMSL